MKAISIICIFVILFISSMPAENPSELEILRAFRTADFEKLQELKLIDLSAATPQGLEALQAFLTADFEKLQKLIDSGVDVGVVMESACPGLVSEITNPGAGVLENLEKYEEFFKLNKEKLLALKPDKGYYVKAVGLLYKDYKENVKEFKNLKELKELLKSCPIKPSALIDKRTGGNLLNMAVSGYFENDVLVALIESGISPNAPAFGGIPSLVWAASIEDEPVRSRILKCLVEHGGDMSFKAEGCSSAEETLNAWLARDEKSKPAK